MLTPQEVLAAVLDAAEKKAAGSAPSLVPTSAASEMAAQVEGPTATVAEVRAIRAKNRQLFETDPAGGLLRFGGVVADLLARIGLAP